MIIIIFAHLNECYTLHLCGTVELKSPIVVFHSIENIPLVGHTNPKMGFEQNFHNLNLGPGLVVNFGLRSILLSLSMEYFTECLGATVRQCMGKIFYCRTYSQHHLHDNGLQIGGVNTYSYTSTLQYTPILKNFYHTYNVQCTSYMYYTYISFSTESYAFETHSVNLLANALLTTTTTRMKSSLATAFFLLGPEYGDCRLSTFCI